jgi:hypothetical protein
VHRKQLLHILPKNFGKAFLSYPAAQIGQQLKPNKFRSKHNLLNDSLLTFGGDLCCAFRATSCTGEPEPLSAFEQPFVHTFSRA